MVNFVKFWINFPHNHVITSTNFRRKTISRNLILQIANLKGFAKFNVNANEKKNQQSKCILLRLVFIEGMFDLSRNKIAK